MEGGRWSKKDKSCKSSLLTPPKFKNPNKISTEFLNNIFQFWFQVFLYKKNVTGKPTINRCTVHHGRKTNQQYIIQTQAFIQCLVYTQA